MNALLAARCGAQSGLFSAADAAMCGYDARSLRSLVKAGACVRVTRGLYAVRRDGLTAEERHARLTKAMLLRYAGRAVASHHSALLLHGLPVYGVDLGQAQLMGRRAVNSRTSRDVCLHLPVGAAGLTAPGGWPAVSPAMALVQTATRSGAYSGVIAADAALHRKLLSVEDLRHASQRVRQHPGARAVQRMLRFVDGRSESVGESRLRLELLMLGIPVLPQFTVRDSGQVVARVDFHVKGTRVLVEFDGLLKYRGEGGAAALIAEKRREDRVRRLGWLVERVVWSELDHPEWIGARVRASVRSARSQ